MNLDPLSGMDLEADLCGSSHRPEQSRGEDEQDGSAEFQAPGQTRSTVED